MRDIHIIIPIHLRNNITGAFMRGDTIRYCGQFITLVNIQASLLRARLQSGQIVTIGFTALRHASHTYEATTPIRAAYIVINRAPPSAIYGN